MDRLHNSGVRQWTVEDGVASKSAVAYAVATDSSGNSYVAGCTSGALDGQSQIGTNDYFVTKYNAAGVRQWTVQDGYSGGNVCGNAIATDSSGAVYVAGQTNVALDGQTLHGTTDFFMTKFSSAGGRQWTIQDGSAAQTIAYGIAIDASGGIFVAGSVVGPLDGQAQLGNCGLFITKYSATPTRQWTIVDGATSGNIAAQAIALDSSGNAWITGMTNVAIDGQTAIGTQDIFLSKYSSTGARLVTVEDGVSGTSVGSWGIAVDSSGNAVVTGSTSAAMDGQSKHGTVDMFVSKYSSAGARQWTTENGASGSTVGVAGVAVDSAGYINVVGNVTGAAIDGQTQHGAIDGQTQHGATDLFVSQYSSAGVHE